MKENINKLKKFLIEAKQKTYASNDSTYKRKLHDGSILFEYENKDLIYRDLYKGSSPFIGRETVSHGGEVIWEMFYYGFIIDERQNPNKEEIYRFLKKALLQMEEKFPYREKDSFSCVDMEGFLYKTEVDKFKGSFHGVECIYYNDTRVYKAYYRGGVV